jgi:flagellar hook-associated protein 3 FlgL
MRVTEKMIFENSIAQTGKSRENLSEAQNEVASGTRVQHPGDDPVAAALSVGHTVDKARFTAVGLSAQKAADELNAADTALDGITTVANRAQVIATQFGNDSYSAVDRATAAVEVNGLFQETVSLLNTTYGGRYIFGGFKDNAVPFDATGAYQGDSNVRTVEVAPGLYQAASLDANAIVKGADGGVDLLQTMTDLSKALQNNDGTGIRAGIDKLNSSINQLAAGRTQAGMAQDAFQTAVTTAQTAASNETVTIGKLLDADILDASTRLASAQYALNATLTASAKTLGMSLADKLP